MEDELIIIDLYNLFYNKLQFAVVWAQFIEQFLLRNMEKKSIEGYACYT